MIQWYVAPSLILCSHHPYPERFASRQKGTLCPLSSRCAFIENLNQFFLLLGLSLGTESKDIPLYSEIYCFLHGYRPFTFL